MIWFDGLQVKASCECELDIFQKELIQDSLAERLVIGVIECVKQKQLCGIFEVYKDFTIKQI